MYRLRGQFFTILILLFAPLFAENLEYKLGHGYQVGSLPLYVGGYFSLEYEDQMNQYTTVKLDDLALMLYGEHEKFNYMLELEANDLYSNVIDDEDTRDTYHFNVHIERFYLEYAFNENYTLRAGKYNSLIGFWNPLPINVLRDTTSNPVITELLFPRFTSGIKMNYLSHNESDLSIDIMLQENEDIDKFMNDDIYNNLEVDQHYGVVLSAQTGDLHYRMNAGYYRLLSSENKYYIEGSFSYNRSQYRIQGEVGTQFDDAGTSIPYIGYIQGLYEVSEGYESIVRIESYKNNNTDIEDTFAVIGYTYRPMYPIAVKGEYQWHSESDLNALVFSISVLF